MRIKNKQLRDFCSIVFTVYYLFAAEQADEKVRKVRAVMTVDHLRTSWNKAATSPYLRMATKLLRPVNMRYGPRHLTINRPRESAYKEPIEAWMYFDGPLSELRKQTNVVVDVPGGGYVAMSPRNHDDKLIKWAVDTKLPILSLEYKKAPEHPYPYALNECFDVYNAIVGSYGQCLGLTGATCPRITLTGDSAGGNLATALTLMIISANNNGGYRGHDIIPLPAGLILLYPSLDMNIGSWMGEDQMALIRSDRVIRKENSEFLRRKSEDLRKRYTPATTPKASNDQFNPFDSGFKDATSTDEGPPAAPKPEEPSTLASQKTLIERTKPQRLRTRLAVSSIISYFGDRTLTPEIMRAIIILYVGPYNRPDFKTDYLLSPAVAPDTLLSQFPKTYFMTGERDPLVDDTVIFAGRLRKAKEAIFKERKDLGLEKSNASFKEKQHVEVVLIPGISHGFAQFVSVFPDGWKHLRRCSGWIQEIFASKPTIFEAPGIIARQTKTNLPNIQTNNSTPGLEMNAQRSAALPRDQHHSGEEYDGDGGPFASGATTPTTSGDEDAPLMMSSLTSDDTATQQQKKQQLRYTKHHNNEPRGSAARGRGRGATSGTPGPEGQEGGRRTSEGDSGGERGGGFYKLNGKGRGGSEKSSQLGSEEDLLKRRMNELTMSIQGSDF